MCIIILFHVWCIGTLSLPLSLYLSLPPSLFWVSSHVSHPSHYFLVVHNTVLILWFVLVYKSAVVKSSNIHNSEFLTSSSVGWIRMLHEADNWDWSTLPSCCKRALILFKVTSFTIHSISFTALSMICCIRSGLSSSEWTLNSYNNKPTVSLTVTW